MPCRTRDLAQPFSNPIMSLIIVGFNDCPYAPPGWLARIIITGEHGPTSINSPNCKFP
jgi:hypothetical protein